MGLVGQYGTELGGQCETGLGGPVRNWAWWANKELGLVVRQSWAWAK